MSELTAAEYADPYILHIGRWAGLQGDTIQLLDPATGDALRTDRPPVWLASDPRLAEGYDALANPKNKHRLTIAYGRHATAADLGKWRWFERQYAKSDVHAFEEAEGWDPAAWQETMKALRHKYHANTLPQSLLESETFLARLMRTTLANEHVADFSYDVHKSDKPLDKLLLEISSKQPSTRLKSYNLGVQKALGLAVGMLREWYIPGKYMYELLQLDLPPSPRSLMTIGAGHKDITRKFGLFGFVSREKHLPLSPEHKMKTIMYAEAMRTGRINFKALGRISLR